MAKVALNASNMDSMIATIGWGILILSFLVGLTVTITVFMNKWSFAGVKLVLDSMSKELIRIADKVKSEDELDSMIDRKVKYHEANCPLAEHVKKLLEGKK